MKGQSKTRPIEQLSVKYMTHCVRDHPTQSIRLGLLTLKVGADNLLHHQRTSTQTEDY